MVKWLGPIGSVPFMPAPVGRAQCGKMVAFSVCLPISPQLHKNLLLYDCRNSLTDIPVCVAEIWAGVAWRISVCPQLWSMTSGK